MCAAPNNRSLTYLVLLFCCITATLPLEAQHKHTAADSLSVFEWLAQSDKLVLGSSFDQALNYCDKALQLSRQKKYLQGEAHAHVKMADIFLRKGELGKVAAHDSFSLHAGLRLKDSLLIGLSYYQMGLLATYRSNYDEGGNYFNKALHIHFEKAQSTTTAVIYNDIGYMYGRSGDLDKQLEWLLKALRLYDRMHDDAGLAQTLNNISTALNEAGRIVEALQYVRQSAMIRERINDIQGMIVSYNNMAQMYVRVDSLDQAIQCQQKALKHAEMAGITSGLMHSYITMSVILNRQRKNPEALEYEKKAIALLENKDMDQNMLARRYIAAAILSGSAAVKDSVGALEYFKKGHDLSLRLNNKYNLRDVFLHRAIFYKDRKDYYNAYESYKKYTAYKDSIINTETLAKMADVETRYETEKKDRAIAVLNAEQKIRQLELEKQKAVIAGNREEAKRKQNEIDLLVQSQQLQELKIKQQEEELEKQLLLSQAKEQKLQLAEKERILQVNQLRAQRQLRNAWIIGTLLILALVGVLFNRYQLKKKLEQQKALEAIRTNIARDLHDDIGSTLTSISILSKVSQNNLSRDIHKSAVILENITEQSQQIQQAMSDIVWTIRPDNDKLENMVIRMREYVSHTLESKNIDIDFDVDKDILQQTLAMEQRRDFFLVFKEAINNAAKYSQASRVVIRLSRRDNCLQLTVKDNGKGFDTSLITSSSGLKGMRERATALGANLSIESAPLHGTTVQLQF